MMNLEVRNIETQYFKDLLSTTPDYGQKLFGFSQMDGVFNNPDVDTQGK